MLASKDDGKSSCKPPAEDFLETVNGLLQRPDSCHVSGLGERPHCCSCVRVWLAGEKQTRAT